MKRAVSLLVEWSKWVAAVTLGLMMFLTTADVVGRYLFKRAIVAAHDVTELMMVVVIFLGLAYTASVKGHVSVDVLTSRFPSPTRTVLDKIMSLLSIVVFATIAWRLGSNAWSSYRLGAGTPTVGIPISPFLFLASIGCTLLCVQLLIDLFESQAREKRKTELGDDK